MPRITVVIRSRLKDFNCTLDRQEDQALPKQVIAGKFDEPKERLVELFEPSQKGRLETTIANKRYKITELDADGNFKAVPVAGFGDSGTNSSTPRPQ